MNPKESLPAADFLCSFGSPNRDQQSLRAQLKTKWMLANLWRSRI